VVESIVNQVDVLFVALNGYEDVPEFLKDNPKIRYDILDGHLGDAGKFLHVAECDGLYFSFDDDLLYNPNHCEYLSDKIKEYNCIVTLHGRQFRIRPIKSFRRSATLNFHCLYHKSNDVLLDIGGTGVMGFDTQRFRLSIDDFPLPNMADIFVGKKAFQQGVPIMGIRHRGDYLKYLSPTETIWLSSRDDTIQTKILNSFLK
jgi:hypothetical protein